MFSNWYGRVKPKDVTLELILQTDYILIVINNKPIKSAVWIHRKTLNDLQEKDNIEKALEYFETQGS
jgi:hypothetical protein